MIVISAGKPIMRIVYCYILCLFILLPGCGRANKQPPLSELPDSIDVSEDIKHIGVEKKKKVYEFVEINGEKYPVPVPWRGRKITAKAPDISSLKRIPLKFAYNGSTLYIEKKACDAFIEMATMALEEDIQLLAHSGYRSIRYQRKIFSNLMAGGRSWDDLIRYVAPPGYSKHMLGQAIDLYPSNWRFASTNEYAWLQEHAEKFGFSETYPEFSSEGFPWESWHWQFDEKSR